MHLCGGWFALPTTDQAAVLDAFGLSDAGRSFIAGFTGAVRKT
jgi:hypothetical protein